MSSFSMPLEKGDILRWVYGRILGRPMNFSFIDDHVAGSASPLSKKEVNWLREKKGIRAILSVREGPLVNGWVNGLRYLNVQVKNHYVPSLQQVKECVDFVVAESQAGNKVVVHCAAGRGRTGTVLAAYLCYKGDISPEDAIREVRAKRHGSIERKQESVIREYYEDLRKSLPSSSQNDKKSLDSLSGKEGS